MGNLKKSDPWVRSDVVVDLLALKEPTSGNISFVYHELLYDHLIRFPVKARSKWEEDIGSITDDQWVNFLKDISKTSCLSHIQYIFLTGCIGHHTCSIQSQCVDGF